MSTIGGEIKALPASFWISDPSGKAAIRFTESDGDLERLAKQLTREVILQALTDVLGLDVTGIAVRMSSNAVDTGNLNTFDSVFLEYSLNRRPALAHLPQFPFLGRAGEPTLPASTALSEEGLDRIHEHAGGSLMVLILSDGHGQVSTQTGEGRDRFLSLLSRVKHTWSRPARQP